MARAQSRKRTGAAIATSLLFHSAMILPLAILIPRLPSPKLGRNEPMEVELSQKSPAVEPGAASRTAHMTPSSVIRAARPSVTDRTQKAQDHPTVPSAVVEAAQGGQRAGSTGQAGSAASGSDVTAGRVRQALRLLNGCETPGSAAELEACRGERTHQHAIGEAMRMDPLAAAKRAAYDQARDMCQSVYTYSPLDSDPSHTAKAPQVYGNPC
jgi:hypothetical protein